jgi:hypothetical protein
MAQNGDGSLKNLMKIAFPFFNEEDNADAGISFESGAGYSATAFTEHDKTPNQSPLTTTGGKDGDNVAIMRMPKDRFAKYDILQEMAQDSTISAALNLHLSYALSTPTDGDMCMYLEPIDEKDTEYVKQLEREVVTPIARNAFNWGRIMAIYGVGYFRPYAEPGKGITHFECNYYTMPRQIREYERSGQLAGFTSENLKEHQDGAQVRLAEPWSLVSMKMPLHTPDLYEEPVNYGGEKYSLYSDAYTRTPMETQNYGTSILESAYESWTLLRQSIRSLSASRVNAAMIDRIITAEMEGLDSGRAAEYINGIAQQFQKDRDNIVKHANKSGVIPTVINRILPSLSPGKGGLNIDTFSIDPNIAHIEDIMFQLKRMAGTLGVDPSMLGFGDLLAGGLGEGGYFRTSIQAALIANLIRSAMSDAVHRSIDIHTIYKDGKVWTDANRPYRLKFHSVNTALALEEAQANESAANYATTLATVLDMIEQSAITQSPSLKSHFYTSVLKFDAEKSKVFISELAKKVKSDDQLLESAGLTPSDDIERMIKNVVLDFISNM